MFDLNIPWPTQTFADAQRVGTSRRAQLELPHPSGGLGAGGSAGGAPGAIGLDGAGDGQPLSKKARQRLKKQLREQQLLQQQQGQGGADTPSATPTVSATAAPDPPNAPAPAPTEEWNPLDDLPAPDRLRLQLLTHTLASLGYTTCAYNHTFGAPTRFDPSRHGNPFSGAGSAAVLLSGGAGGGGGLGAGGKVKGKGGGGAGGLGPIASAPRVRVAPVPFPELDPRFRGSSSNVATGKGKAKAKAKAKADAATMASTAEAYLALDPSLLDPGSTPLASHRITQLHRLTLPLDDSSCSAAAGQGHGITNAAGPALQSYDLLAVRPTTEASFSLACLSLAELRPYGIDIISLDLGASPRLPFWVKRSLVRSALQMGVVFEIAYADAMPGPPSSSSTMAKSGGGGGGGGVLSSDTTRRNLIAATRSLLLLTKGTNVILSSGARDAMQLRAPRDVINLFGAILGMGEGAARAAVGSGPEAVVRRARARKEVWRGVVGEVRVRGEGEGGGGGGVTIPSGEGGGGDALGTATPSRETTQAQGHEHKKKRKRDTADAG